MSFTLPFKTCWESLGLTSSSPSSFAGTACSHFEGQPVAYSLDLKLSKVEMPRSFFSSSGSSRVKNDRERGHLSVQLLAWVTILVLVVILAEKKADVSATDLEHFHVAPATGRIHDSLGRERIFHGLNVVVKGAPWHPRIDAFDPQSFTDADIALLKAWGINVVRLGIMWPGVEPTRGNVNYTYLEVMRSIVSNLHSAGISTLLEFHQDLYAPQFCGEGMPSWILEDNSLSRPLIHVHQKQKNPSPSLTPLDQNATHEHHSEDDHHNGNEEAHLNRPPDYLQGASDRRQSSNRLNNMPTTKMRYPASFPEPLGRRWPWPSEWEQDEWEPPVERCNKHEWWMFYLSYAVSRAFQDLYDNKWGWGDLLVRYWIVVAAAFKDQPGVLGYEIMNEPWPGDVFTNPLLFLPGVADKKNLAPFYEKLQAAVRSVDRERILFFETITFDNFRCGWSTVPGGAKWRNKTVLSYHYYTPPNFSAKQAFKERLKESRRLGCGLMLTEFFVSTELGQDEKYSRKIRLNTLRSDSRAETDKEALQLNPAGEDMEGDEMIEADKESDRSLEEFHPLPIDVKTSATKVDAQNDHQHVSVGIDTEEGRKEVKKDLKSSQVKPLPAAEKSMQLNTTEKVDSVDTVLLEADAYIQSWIGWEYKAFFHKTGSIAKQSLFNEDGEVDLILAKKLARTYPQSVCGNIISFSFDPATSLFAFTYVAGLDCTAGEGLALTEIFVQKEFYYPNGLLVDVHPSCASFSETDRIVQVRHTATCSGHIIDVLITRVHPIL